MNHRSRGSIERTDWSLPIPDNRTRWIRLALVFASACLLAVPRVYGAEFIPLGDLPGGHVRSRAMAISGNGLVVVGASSSAFSMHLDEAFRWTAEEGLVGLGAFPDRGLPPSSIAFDVSHDGSVVVGRSGMADQLAFRWTAEGGMVALGLLPGDPMGAGSIAWGTSADGNVVVGQSGLLNKAFRWTAAEGMVPIIVYRIH